MTKLVVDRPDKWMGGKRGKALRVWANPDGTAYVERNDRTKWVRWNTFCTWEDFIEFNNLQKFRV